MHRVPFIRGAQVAWYVEPSSLPAGMVTALVSQFSSGYKLFGGSFDILASNPENVMIIPIVPESEWLSRLRNSPIWQPPLTRTLVIAPHPDDETLAAGGLIAALCSRGVDVQVVAVTDGESAYATGTNLGPVREREQTEALGALGVLPEKITRLRLPDSDVASCEESLVNSLRPLVAGQTHILAPWRRDFHPDHEACGRAAERVASLRHAQLTSYFFWTWHRGIVETLDGLHLACFPVSAEEQAAKHKALMCHRSQLEHESGQPILPDYLLGPARRSFEVFLPA